MNDDLIRALAEMLAGLNAPRAMGLLGAATDPRDAVCHSLRLWGYFNADEAEQAIRAALQLRRPR